MCRTQAWQCAESGAESDSVLNVQKQNEEKINEEAGRTTNEI